MLLSLDDSIFVLCGYGILFVLIQGKIHQAILRVISSVLALARDCCKVLTQAFYLMIYSLPTFSLVSNFNRISL